MSKSKIHSKIGITCVLFAAGILRVSGADAVQPSVKTDAELFSALDNSIWIADGKVADKQVYVISAPWCAFCRGLYQRAGRYTDQVQFRWIETGATDPSSSDSIAEAATRRDGSVLNRMYETREAPPGADATIRENANRYNFMVERAIEARVAALSPMKSDTGTGYPMLLWMSKDGVRVQIGVPDRLDTLVGSVVARPDAAAITPVGLDFLKVQYRSEPPLPGFVFAKTDGLQMFSFPDAKSQLVRVLGKGGGMTALRRVKVNGEVWVELSVWKSSTGTPAPGLFVREADVYRER